MQLKHDPDTRTAGAATGPALSAPAASGVDDGPRGVPVRPEGAGRLTGDEGPSDAMEPRSLNHVANACGGSVDPEFGQLHVNRVSTDTRQIHRGDLFVAIRGDRFDGHDFLGAAAAGGASAVMVETGEAHRLKTLPVVLPAILVDSTRRALGRFAARYRQEFHPFVVAVAGSNGKTTTKEILASLLRQRFSTLWNAASFNNDIGVPLTLLRLSREHEAAVMEAGTNHPGELAPLLRQIRPHAGILTGIGGEHLEFFKDLAGVAREEGALGELLPATGTLFVNGDSPAMDVVTARTRAAVVRVGFGPENDWRVGECRIEPTGTRFMLEGPDPEMAGSFTVRLPGKHHALNAALAIAAAWDRGVTRSEVHAGLRAFRGAARRMEAKDRCGAWILDDSYNANLDSVLAALETLVAFPEVHRRYAVLGEMAELGEHSAESHAEVGHRAAALGLDHLFVLGEGGAMIGNAARKAGLDGVSHYHDVQAAARGVAAVLRPGDVVLVKASRCAGLDRLSDWLCKTG